MLGVATVYIPRIPRISFDVTHVVSRDDEEYVAGDGVGGHVNDVLATTRSDKLEAVLVSVILVA